MILFALFFVLWLGLFFNLDLMKPIDALFSSIYATANAGFYFMYFLIVSFVLLIVYITRWLDYWEVLPNEILHHHGPLSDLERFPTMNLKFDKEIPDVLEYASAGRGATGAARSQHREVARARQRPLHQLQGRDAQEADEPARSPRHDRSGSGRTQPRERDGRRGRSNGAAGDHHE